MSAECKTALETMLGEPLDLLSLDTSERRPWLPGATRFLRPGVPALIFAARGAGKSLAALVLSAQVVAAGGRVAYLDFENGPRRQAERLNAILADRGESVRQGMAERFDYYPRARLRGLGNHEQTDAWGEAFAGCSLVVIDSLARALGQLALDENSAADFSAFALSYIDPLSARGVASLLLDNVGHDEKGRSRGTSTKEDLVELAYKATSDPIAPHLHGHIYLTRTRTRDGDEAPTLEVGVGGGTYTRLEASDAAPFDRELHDVVQAVLEAGGHLSADNALGREAIVKGLRDRGVKGADTQLRERLSEVVSDPTTAVRHVAKRGYFLDVTSASQGMGGIAAQGSLGEADAQVRRPSDENGSTEPDAAWASSSPIAAQGGPSAMGSPVGSPGAPTETDKDTFTSVAAGTIEPGNAYDPTGEWA